MGGVWESLVKPIKKTLKAIVKDRISIEDCQYTFLCEAEAVLHSRPWTAISDNINELEPLTPNHLLIGASSTNYRTGVFHSNEIELRKKRRAVQAAADMFWVRWTRKYLPLLSIRKKKELDASKFQSW